MLDIAILGDPRKPIPTLAINNEANDGVYKLVQRVLILLFTDINEPTQLGLGTDLSEHVVSANILDDDLLQALFDQSLDIVRGNLLLDQLDDDPLDEKVDALEALVLPTDVRGEQFVEITVTTEAGVEVTVSLPITSLFTEEAQ